MNSAHGPRSTFRVWAVAVGDGDPHLPPSPGRRRARREADQWSARRAAPGSVPAAAAAEFAAALIEPRAQRLAVLNLLVGQLRVAIQVVPGDPPGAVPIDEVKACERRVRPRLPPDHRDGGLPLNLVVEHLRVDLACRK